MDNREQNENLTPRQIERREMAEKRRRRERRNYMILLSALVVLVIAIVACITLLVKSGKDRNAEKPAESTPGSQIVIPEDVNDPEPTQEPTKEPDTEPTTEAPTEEPTEPDTQETTEPEDEEPTQEPVEETTIPPATVEVPDYADQMFFADADSRYLEYADYADLSRWELILARNEIFARHGRRFQDTDIQAYFNSCDWYKGTVDPDDFDYSVLNDYEVQNVKTLLAASGG